jgi:predicted acylesterase/phospholipase RssA/CRP-like cAMP-binding protein
MSATVPRAELERLVGESSMFGRLDPVAQAFLRDRFEPRVLPGGAVLMRQGDAEDSLFLVAVGRLRVMVERNDGTEALVAELGRGDVVGELAVLTDERRSATVTALRDSQVFELSSASFAELVARHPAALREITSEVVRRLVLHFHDGSPTSPVVTITVVPLSDDRSATEFASRLTASLLTLTGAATEVTLADATSALGDLAHVSGDRLAAWFGEREAGTDAVVYAARAVADHWTEACVRQADLVLLVGAARENPGIRDVERAIDARRSRVRVRTELVLVHGAMTRDPRGTRQWLRARRVDRHHHVRVDRSGDVDRVARLLLGRGIGVVFSGGGARGIAAIGVLSALRERGVPVDACGGTSIGSLIAGGTARGLEPEEIAHQLRVAVVESSPFDVTFPVVSLAAGRRVTERIREAAGGLDLEDAWRNLFCVSTNLTTGGVEVHRDGPGWHAVRASFSIPGVFPPVRSRNGDLLVDGGLLDNLPVEIMRAEHDGITVIAVDVGRTRDLVAGALPGGGVVSGWRLLLGRLDRGAHGNGTAGLGRIMMRLTELGSGRGSDRGDVYIRPAVDAYGIADFKAFDEILRLGREAGLHSIDEWRGDVRSGRYA